VLSSAFWAVYLFGLKPFLQRYGSMAIGALTFLMGAAVLAPFALTEQWTFLSRFDLNDLLLLLLSSAVAINAGNLFYYRAIRALDLSVVATFSNLAPLASAILAFAFLGELDLLDQSTVIGGLLIISGVAFAERYPKPR
jgi:drug/metabolite transporter (DMT)-like permease